MEMRRWRCNVCPTRRNGERTDVADRISSSVLAIVNGWWTVSVGSSGSAKDGGRWMDRTGDVVRDGCGKGDGVRGKPEEQEGGRNSIGVDSKSGE